MKPTIEQQIAYMRKDRVSFENGLTLLEDPKDIQDFEQEIEMMKAIEENLIAVKMLEESRKPNDICGKCQAHSDRLDQDNLCPKCAIAEGVKTDPDKGHYTFTNPVARKWPKPGDSVMVLLDHKGKTEWVDAYVVQASEYQGKYIRSQSANTTHEVLVKTYWGALYAITDFNKIYDSRLMIRRNGEWVRATREEYDAYIAEIQSKRKEVSNG